MAQTLSFTKMQGCGNDYVYVNGFEEHITDPESLAKRVSDRHFGIGSDGLVLILPSNKADVRMRMFNPDGSEAQMCGNATRCVARYAFEHGLVADRVVKVETGAGVRVARLLLDGGRVTGATVDMGAPILEAEKIPKLPSSRDRSPFLTGKSASQPCPWATPMPSFFSAMAIPALRAWIFPA